MSLSELSTHGVGRIPLTPSWQEKDWLYHSPVKGTERGHGGIWNSGFPDGRMLRKLHWLLLRPLKSASSLWLLLLQTLPSLHHYSHPSSAETARLSPSRRLRSLVSQGLQHQLYFKMTRESRRVVPSVVQLHPSSPLVSCPHARQARRDTPAPSLSHHSVPGKFTLQGLTGLWHWPTTFLSHPCLLFLQHVPLFVLSQSPRFLAGFLDGLLFLQKSLTFFLPFSWGISIWSQACILQQVLRGGNRDFGLDSWPVFHICQPKTKSKAELPQLYLKRSCRACT